MAPKNGWLEYYFPIGMAFFAGAMLVLGRVHLHTQTPFSKKNHVETIMASDFLKNILPGCGLADKPPPNASAQDLPPEMSQKFPPNNQNLPQLYTKHIVVNLVNPNSVMSQVTMELRGRIFSPEKKVNEICKIRCCFFLLMVPSKPGINSPVEVR